jgi:AcrR family transcriptional regulator
MAGISSPMLLRYFGSKAGLFEAALIETMRVGTLFDERRDRFGEHLTSLFQDASVDIEAPSILALSTGHADARARALEIVTLAMGCVVCTRLYPLASGRKGADKKLAKWFAQMLQGIVDQS